MAKTLFDSSAVKAARNKCYSKLKGESKDQICMAIRNVEMNLLHGGKTGFFPTVYKDS